MEVIFSSIAWKRETSFDVVGLLRKCGVSGIEASPGLFDRPLTELKAAHIAEVRKFWEGEGLPIRAMQALLFGQPTLRLFGSADERRALEAYMEVVFKVAGQLGGGPLVFGSPKNRCKGGLHQEVAFDIAVNFFGEIARSAVDNGCILCIEANASGYGCDFITTHFEAIKIVRAVSASGFGLHIDTGVMKMNEESVKGICQDLLCAGLSPIHIHCSEPYLVPVEKCSVLHHDLADLLSSIDYTGLVSIEMCTPTNFQEAAPRAIAAVTSVFRY